MNKIYNINWLQLVNDLVLPSVKKTTLPAYINSLLAPLRGNYGLFLRFKEDAEYRIRHNGQVCWLQKMLNDKFDNTLRRIRVENIVPRTPLWVYVPADNKPLYVHNSADYPVYVYRTDDYYRPFDFQVLIPYSLGSLKSRMMAQINYYKLFSKNYKIVEV